MSALRILRATCDAGQDSTLVESRGADLPTAALVGILDALTVSEES
jgi:hypothetical protein